MSGKRMQSYNSFTSVSVTLASHVQQITILSPFQNPVRAEGFTVNILAEYNMIDPRPFGLLTCTFHKCICDIFLISNHQENSVEEFRPKIHQRSLFRMTLVSLVSYHFLPLTYMHLTFICLSIIKLIELN